MLHEHGNVAHAGRTAKFCRAAAAGEEQPPCELRASCTAQLHSLPTVTPCLSVSADEARLDANRARRTELLFGLKSTAFLSSCARARTRPRAQSAGLATKALDGACRHDVPYETFCMHPISCYCSESAATT